MNTSLKILYKVTSRSRPELCKRAIKSILDNEADDNRLILVSLDSDDETMTTPEIMEWLSEHGCTVIYGRSKNKVDAINRDVDKISEHYKWDILVNVSDDQVFIKKWFDNVIREYVKDNLKLFLHFPDGNQKNLCTMSIIGNDYYDLDKYIYHPDYKSLFCDNEAQEVAIIRGAYKFVDDTIFEHLHPAWGKAQTDSQYQHTESFWSEDETTYHKRKSNNYGI